MKHYLLASTLLAAIMLSACSLKTEQTKPFLVSEIDSATVEDGAGNPIRISLEYIKVGPTCELDGIIAGPDELNQFIESIFWNLGRQSRKIENFVPVKIRTCYITDSVPYRREKIYSIRACVEGIASDAYGEETPISADMKLLGWRNYDLYGTTNENGEDEVKEMAYWYIVPDSDRMLEYLKEEINNKESDRQQQEQEQEQE